MNSKRNKTPVETENDSSIKELEAPEEYTICPSHDISFIWIWAVEMWLKYLETGRY